MSSKPPKIVLQNSRATRPGAILGRSGRGKNPGPVQLLDLNQLRAMGITTKPDMTGVVYQGTNPILLGTIELREITDPIPVISDPKGSMSFDATTGAAWSYFGSGANAPTFVQDATAWLTYAATLGAAPTVGNYLIAFATSNTAAPVVAAGWTAIALTVGHDSIPPIGTIYRSCAYHLVGNGEAAAQTPFTGSGPNGIAIIEVSGPDQAAFGNSLANAQAAVSADTGSTSFSYTTANANNLAISCGMTVNSIGQSTTTLGGTTTWTNQSSNQGVTIGSATITSGGTVVNATATFSGGGGDKYTDAFLIVLAPTSNANQTGWHQVSYLTQVYNGGVSISADARSLNFLGGLTASSDSSGNITVTGTGAVGGGGGGMPGRRGIRGRWGPPGVAGAAGAAGSAGATGPAGAAGAPGVPGRDGRPRRPRLWFPPGEVGGQTNVSAILDQAFGSTQGTIIYRDSLDWKSLAVGTNGQFLQTQGSAANPKWGTPGGGGGAGQHEYEAFGALPLAATFTKVNQVASTLTDTSLTLFLSWGNGGGNNIEGYFVAAPSTPYDVYMKFNGWLGVSNAQTGLLLRNSSNGKIVTFSQNYTTNLSGQNWTNATTFSANIFTAVAWSPIPKWLRFHNDGTTITFYVSNDGVAWYSFTTATLASFIGTADQIGFFACPGTTPTQGANWIQSFGTAAPS